MLRILGPSLTSIRRWYYRRKIHIKTTRLPEIAEVQSDDLSFDPPTLDLAYRPTFCFAGYLNREHAAWADWPLTSERILQHPIFGWLRRADALKLYEMAALSKGDVLEFGTHQGLSTHIMASAIKAFGGGQRIDSFDLDSQATAKARENLAREIAVGRVTVTVGEAATECRRLIAEGNSYGFVFVDHSHCYHAMCEICALLPAIVKRDGFVLFHDFTDPRSTAPIEGRPEPDFGVLAACRNNLPSSAFEYVGAYGCSGLFRRLG